MYSIPTHTVITNNLVFARRQVSLIIPRNFQLAREAVIGLPIFRIPKYSRLGLAKINRNAK